VTPPTRELPAVGVVGLGAMGGPIADRLLEAGATVRVADLDPAALASRVDRGAVAVPVLADLARHSDVVLVVVRTDEDVLAVCNGPRGLLAGARPGSTVVLCSSLRPETCQAVQDAAPTGVDVLDAALTGGIGGVTSGRTNLLVGGDPEVVARVRPALEPWTSAINHLGPLGAGQVAKTVNNLIHWSQISVINEAFELGVRYGLDVDTLRAALLNGPTSSATMRNLETFRFTWHAKDIANGEAMAERVALALPMTAAAREVMKGLTPRIMADLLRAEGAEGVDPQRPSTRRPADRPSTQNG
jgi:3-hydroxyisobutyrate dehydrogenase-like beta-hydroxyacid dehydrogenase